ncbi:MAG TPA: PPC domain-containing DNA-binding protein [Roseiflexaceae bacterium]|jgi:predicted DNA-binding protein with PD1-like motif|nr:PPC domain-containing DNA-binding protein [Roseiflexaceae bacterium]
MRAKRLNQQNGERIFVVVFDKGDEFSAGMLDFAQQQQITAAQITAVGAFSDVTLGYFNRADMEYIKIPVNEQVEVLSLMGNIALNDGKPKIHAHVVVGKSDGTTRGGHVLAAHVWPTLEVIVTESPKDLQRATDKETGLALIQW